MAEKKEKKVVQVAGNAGRIIYLFDDGTVATATVYGETLGTLIDVTPKN